MARIARNALKCAKISFVRQSLESHQSILSYLLVFSVLLLLFYVVKLNFSQKEVKQCVNCVEIDKFESNILVKFADEKPISDQRNEVDIPQQMANDGKHSDSEENTHLVDVMKPSSWSVETRAKRYSVLKNFIPSEISVENVNSVTLTTQATYDFLHHSEQICQRWDGPVSIAVYAPGDQLRMAVTIARFMRLCANSCVRTNITWHFVYDQNFAPNSLEIEEMHNDMDASELDCANHTVLSFISQFKSDFRPQHQLTYPINVLRNVARLSATTKYVFPSDVELYPSANIVASFMELIERESKGLVPQVSNSVPHVYVLPNFEVRSDVQPPTTKAQLKKLFKSGKAVFFHRYVCDNCHRFPDRNQWINNVTNSKSLNPFRVVRRNRSLRSWEPFFIGTNDEPLFDENMTWEGKRDKMSQEYEMCLMGYYMVILDNAFLVHSPGIKRNVLKDHKQRIKFVRRNNKADRLRNRQLITKYGNSNRC